MKKNSKLLLGASLTWFCLFLGLSVLNIVEKQQSYRLSLTSDGCTLLQSKGMTVEKSMGSCATVAAFAPFSVRNGGSLFLNDGKILEITDSIFLASEESDIPLPPTPTQITGMKWVYFFLSMAAAAACYTLYIKLFIKE